MAARSGTAVQELSYPELRTRLAALQQRLERPEVPKKA
jgi:uncharacterized small protein (DUF1192 family)